MAKKYYLSVAIIALSLTVFYACTKDGGLALLSVQQELELGRQTDSTILANPSEFPILDASQYPEAYAYMNDMMGEILQSDDINRRDDYVWELKIINKDVKNAFAVPGGYIYFYTGLMKYLENSAQIAGVLAHEVAHVDRRHSNRQISKAYGISFLVGIIFGDDKSGLEQIALDIAAGIESLRYSRKLETESDEYSIRYLKDTDYDPDGIKGFFEKMEAEGSGGSIEFLSTHPAHDTRIEDIEHVCTELSGCQGNVFQDEYDAMIKTLP